MTQAHALCRGGERVVMLEVPSLLLSPIQARELLRQLNVAMTLIDCEEPLPEVPARPLRSPSYYEYRAARRAALRGKRTPLGNPNSLEDIL